MPSFLKTLFSFQLIITRKIPHPLSFSHTHTTRTQMASYHRQPYPSCHHPTPTPTATSCYCCCYYTTYTPYHHPLPPDPHLPSLSPHLHHPPQPHLFSPYTPQYHPPQLHPHPQTQTPHCFQELPHHHHHHQEQQQELTHPLIISSLLRRISALEATLKRYSASSYSLRDASARTIQTHFRAFLVRRSRTLGQLKELTSIKSTLNALKSSVSENAHFDPQALSLKTMDLLLKLDSIQGGDPMIRDGKRSISRELNQLMEFIDGVSIKRSELSCRIIKNVKCGGNGNKSRDLSIGKMRANVESVKSGRRGDVMEKLRERIERIERMNGLNRVSEEDGEEDEELESPAISLVRSGVSINKSDGLMKGNTGAPARAKRSVRFVEDGNVYRFFRSSHDPASNGDCDTIDGSDSVDAEGELIGNLSRKVEEVGFLSKEMVNDDEEAQTEDEGSPRSSDGERDMNCNLKSRDDVGRKSYDEGEDGDFVFSAPLPVKMESRADFMNKRKSIKV